MDALVGVMLVVTEISTLHVLRRIWRQPGTHAGGDFGITMWLQGHPGHQCSLLAGGDREIMQDLSEGGALKVASISLSSLLDKPERG